MNNKKICLILYKAFSSFTKELLDITVDEDGA